MSSSPPTCAAFAASTGGTALPSPSAPLDRNHSNLDAKIAETRQAVACTDATISALLVRARCALENQNRISVLNRRSQCVRC
jgi:hypothetical protein